MVAITMIKILNAMSFGRFYRKEFIFLTLILYFLLWLLSFGLLTTSPHFLPNIRQIIFLNFLFRISTLFIFINFILTIIELIMLQTSSLAKKRLST
ncbi:MAG: hypothetical protein QW156_04505 [Candidatus Aenigmatarchaeota archaeon]